MATDGGAGRLTGFARSAETWLRPVFVGLATLAALCGASIVALIGASVAMRHIANAPFRFTEELVGLLMTACFFLALPLVTLDGGHVRVQLGVDALPDRARKWAAIVAGGCGVLFCVWLVMLSLPWFDFAFERGIKTEVSRLLLWPWMALIPSSLALTALALLLRAVLRPAGADAARGTDESGRGHY